MRSKHLRENFIVFQAECLAIASVLSMGIHGVRMLHPSLINPVANRELCQKTVRFVGGSPLEGENHPPPMIALLPMAITVLPSVYRSIGFNVDGVGYSQDF